MINLALLCLLLAAASPDCSKLIVPYQDRSKIQNPVFTLDLTSPAGGRLLYVGAPRHSFDPNDPEFSEFEKDWDDFKPTAAFFEGPENPVGSSRDDAIKNGGEPGLIRFLAARDKVAVASLEPSRQDEVNDLLTRFSPEQVKLFYVLRIIAEDRVRRKLSEAELRAEVGGLLKYFSKLKGLEGVIRTPDELEAAYRRYWTTPQDWWEARSDWFNPLKPSSETGGVFTNEINQASSSYRDVNMVRVLAKAALEGKRVFAVVGRDHIPMQAAALRCALK
jgi:hypothetical protein